MAFDQFANILVYKSIFSEKNDLSMGTPYTFDEGMSCHSTRIELFYFDDNFCRIAQWVHFFVVIVAIHQNGYQWKRCFIFGFDYIQTCLIFPL